MDIRFCYILFYTKSKEERKSKEKKKSKQKMEERINKIK